MLTIRQKQIAVFDDRLLTESVQELGAYLREHYPAQLGGIAQPELEARIRAAVRQAEGYGIDTVTDVRRFLEFSIVLRHAADADGLRAWVRGILEQPGLSGTRKMDLIEERMTFECAQRASP